MVELRRTQGERTAHTRGAPDRRRDRLAGGKGWAATTAVEVCRRTGLTRGALVHHFPSLSGLLATALQSVCDDLVSTVPEPRTLVDAVDGTWACVSEARFKAVIEAWLAAANDPELRSEIGPVVATFQARQRRGRLHDVLADADASASTSRRGTMLGLALGRAISSGRALPHETAVVDQLRAEAAKLDRRQIGRRRKRR